ncbi:MAG: cell shape determination protein CcmA [Piscirickettsiaceae bacterium]|nr:MAG: cell shape determination protein CcmA [Piscirickettsiaceae bacterium]PCH84903.1 MAG: cell shape determination protein CcmA [Piscirickettsiaceae bacterium]
MFTSDTKKLKEINTTNVSTIIGDGTVIQGDVMFTGGLHIDGKVIGNVSAAPDSQTTLTLSKMGAIHGNVDVPVVVIDGEVQGDVSGSERVQLLENSNITGNVAYNLIEMSVGAEVNGQLIKQKAGDVASSAKAPAEELSPENLD